MRCFLSLMTVLSLGLSGGLVADADDGSNIKHAVPADSAMMQADFERLATWSKHSQRIKSRRQIADADAVGAKGQRRRESKSRVSVSHRRLPKTVRACSRVISGKTHGQARYPAGAGNLYSLRSHHRFHMRRQDRQSHRHSVLQSPQPVPRQSQLCSAQIGHKVVHHRIHHASPRHPSGPFG